MLDYIALGILCFAAVVLFYGIIVLHDIPYEIAVHRNHPHQDAIHAAGWVSLFTLHALWPFLWIWAMLYREDRGWGFGAGGAPKEHVRHLEAQVSELQARLAAIEAALPARQQGASAEGES
ncbi:DUF3302 domain-containing protein [Pseudomonas sp. ZM23]|uniref:DUF3302 domain-containing protein n=1 Tax=Pseudomonas triclosanedens TaxID=2961893 RepID=A0ABY7A3S6_9PSED|nr:DUF3302 domain-containing protein [Pseudomonas triclosanedens]MCP8464660.1 DUF3302 domain-containing protein [Pseudomonas triclosanedens]MCP8473591.1 DUF3302 domain-containing protein [Pseudomonas triclosanedens]MCP8478428.1 DUF3302 domain-containing protein [Pseudomonas triclosanedens]WAI50860.1 DUF3302 domain-containing protein [Pseudomonas triclosanedens]